MWNFFLVNKCSGHGPSSDVLEVADNAGRIGLLGWSRSFPPAQVFIFGRISREDVVALYFFFKLLALYLDTRISLTLKGV